MEKMQPATGQTPDKWVIVKYKTADRPVLSVLAGWGGGYLHGSSWRRSSGLTKVRRTEKGYSATTGAGSSYNLRLPGIGTTTHTASIVHQMREESPDGTMFEILDDEASIEAAFREMLTGS